MDGKKGGYFFPSLQSESQKKSPAAAILLKLQQYLCYLQCTYFILCQKRFSIVLLNNFKSIILTETPVGVNLQHNLTAQKNVAKRLPYKCSNIPSEMFYATISAEVLRIARATSKYRCRMISIV